MKIRKRFKYNIFETEPKLENTTIENYAYDYCSSATAIEGCTFSSNYYHVMYEFGSQDDNIFVSLYVPAVITMINGCLSSTKFLIMERISSIGTDECCTNA